MRRRHCELWISGHPMRRMRYRTSACGLAHAHSPWPRTEMRCPPSCTAARPSHAGVQDRRSILSVSSELQHLLATARHASSYPPHGRTTSFVDYFAHTHDSLSYVGLRYVSISVIRECLAMETKVCTSCGQDKPITAFHRFGKDGSRIGKWCSPCYAKNKPAKSANKGKPPKTD